MIEAPVPASVQTILGTVCRDIPGSFNDTTKWVFSRGVGECDPIHRTDLERHDVDLANQIVFVFQVSEFDAIFDTKFTTVYVQWT